MLDKLPPEVLIRIARQVRNPKHPWQYYSGKLENQVQEEQATFLAMLRTSQTVHHATKRVAFETWSTTDVPAFLERLQPGAPFDRIERLQLCHSNDKLEPAYVAIIKGELWQFIGTAHAPGVACSLGISSSMLEEMLRLAESAERCRGFCEESASLLPNLKSVTLGGLGNTAWSQPALSMRVSCQLLTHEDRWAAHALLKLPRFRSVCQYGLAGPLAIGPQIVKPLTPLSAFTYHPRPLPETFDLHRLGFPVVIGAINRYYFNCESICPDSVLPKSESDKTAFLAPIIKMLGSDSTIVYVETPGLGHQEQVDIKNVDLDGTSVHFYNYIRTVPYSPTIEDSVAKVRAAICDRQPSSLESFQTLRTSNCIRNGEARSSCSIERKPDPALPAVYGPTTNTLKTKISVGRSILIVSKSYKVGGHGDGIGR